MAPAAYGMQESKTLHADAKVQADAKLGAQVAQALPQAILDSLNNQKIIQVAVSKAGDLIAVATEDHVARYNAQGEMIGKPITYTRQFHKERNEKISKIALSTDGKVLVIGTSNGCFDLYGNSEACKQGNYQHQGAPVRDISFNESDTWLAVLIDRKTDFNGQTLIVDSSAMGGSFGDNWECNIRDAKFDRIAVSPDGSWVVLYNGTACWLAQAQEKVDEWGRKQVAILDLADNIGSNLEVKSALWVDAKTVLFFVLDINTKKYSSLTFDFKKGIAKHALSDYVDWQGAFLTEMGGRCYLALNTTSSVFTNRLVLYNPVTGKEVCSYRSPLFDNDQFAIGLGSTIFAYSKETISPSDADTSSSSSSASNAHAHSSSSAPSVNAEQKRRHAQSADKKTVRQKMKEAYRDVAFLWRHDKKHFALYAAGACAVVVAGIGAIKYAKKKSLV